MENTEVTETINQDEAPIEKPTEKLFTQEEVNKLVGKTRIEERRKLEKQAVKVEEVQRPRKEDFQNEDEYLDKMLDYKEQERIKRKQAEIEKQDQQELAQRFEHVMTQLDEVDDFDMDYFNKQLTSAGINDYVFTRALIEADNPAELIVYLSDNQDELDKISEMKPGKRATYLGKIEDRLEREALKQPSTLKHKAIGDIKGAQTKVEETDPYKMSEDDFLVYLQKNKRKR